MSNSTPSSMDVSTSMRPELYRVHQVAEILSMSSSMVRNLTSRGVLPCRRIGRMVRYAPEDLRASSTATAITRTGEPPMIHSRVDHCPLSTGLADPASAQRAVPSVTANCGGTCGT